MKQNKKNKQIVLIVVAHPDDEVLGCGGTIAKYAKKGNKVYCLFLGGGKASRYSDKKTAIAEKKQALLSRETQEAAKILGISEIFFNNFPDQKYDTVPFLNLVKSIEKIKETIKPDIIYTHHCGDLNLDHQITFKAVLTACRPVKGETVKEIYSFEVPSSTEWGIPKRKNYFIPNVFVDIFDTLDKKIKAFKAYKSEIRTYPHPRSPRGLEIIARQRGMMAGKELAEAFELVREIE